MGCEAGQFDDGDVFVDVLMVSGSDVFLPFCMDDFCATSDPHFLPNLEPLFYIKLYHIHLWKSLYFW